MPERLKEQYVQRGRESIILRFWKIILKFVFKESEWKISLINGKKPRVHSFVSPLESFIPIFPGREGWFQHGLFRN